MKTHDGRNFSRWFIIISSLTITILILWNIALLFDQIKQNERTKMEIWVKASSLLRKAEINAPISPLVTTVLNANRTTPMIIHSVKEDLYDSKNIPQKAIDTRAEIESLVASFEEQNTPIRVTDQGELLSVVYYGDSEILTKLKYFPAVIFVITCLFILIVYYFYVISTSNEQNKLWAGMAKETAHQIGTPLSSLVGWTHILKDEEVNPSYIDEIIKDIDRLKIITERFSKIGSIPKLEKTEIGHATKISYEYLKSRSSKFIEFSLKLPEEESYVMLNEQLFSWTIENLVRNAIDAMRGKGQLEIEVVNGQNWVQILISDTGKGIPPSQFKIIFLPGETTKKRGWGLGLSLAKRIIAQYHGGKIRVLKSELDKGTTFEIKLRKV